MAVNLENENKQLRLNLSAAKQVIHNKDAAIKELCGALDCLATYLHVDYSENWNGEYDQEADEQIQAAFALIAKYTVEEMP